MFHRSLIVSVINLIDSIVLPLAEEVQRTVQSYFVQPVSACSVYWLSLFIGLFEIWLKKRPTKAPNSAKNVLFFFNEGHFPPVP